MKKRILVVILALTSFLAEALPPAATRPSQFDAGRRAYESGNYARALELFSQAINAASDPSSRNKSYYYQGLVFFELGLYYSSYLSFRNVLLNADDKNREVYEKAIKNAVVITDKLNMVDRIGKVIDKLPNGLIPGSVSGLAHYAVGVHEMNSGTVEAAMSRLKSVNPENQFYDKALFNLGVLSTKKKDYKEAVFYFSKVIDITRGKRESFPLQELSRLNLARSTYSGGDVEKSIEYYSQFLSSSPHWLTVLLEASWPLMRISDTTVSLGNLHTITSPYYREDLVGEAYILRATILHSLCKYEEMKRTLSHFFTLYDPVIRAMQVETTSLGSPESYYRAYATGKGLNRAFMNYLKRDIGIANRIKVLKLLREEKTNLAKFGRSEQAKRMQQQIDETENQIEIEIGSTLQRLHKRKLAELMEQREQANYLKVEIVTGEKELIEGQKGLPPKRIVDVETSVASGYHFWPYTGEYWEDELGTYVYTTESACVN
jgi:tetratricopeptide (TPR) repeat protein